MPAKAYPKPKPSVVIGVSDDEWKRGGRLLPSEIEYNDYVAGDEVEGGPYGPYGPWLAEVEAVKASHGRLGRRPKAVEVERVAASPVQAPVPVKTDVIPPEALVIPLLPWEREARSEANERPLNVDLPVETLDRLKTYAALHKVKLKVVVAGMLDAILTAKGG